jgi:hypothetical protein
MKLTKTQEIKHSIMTQGEALQILLRVASYLSNKQRCLEVVLVFKKGVIGVRQALLEALDLTPYNLLDLSLVHQIRLKI